MARQKLLDQDVAALGKENPVQAMIQNIEDTIGHQRSITERELRDQLKNSAYMLMSYVLARKAHAQDWFSGVVIENNRLSDQTLHHIFPKSLLKNIYKSHQGSRTIDQVANLVFLATPVDVSNTKRVPTDYLPKIDEQRLKAQNMPLQRELWEIDHFEECMMQRRTMLADAINLLLHSLAGEKYFAVHGPKEMMEDRVSAIERQLRQLVEHRLNEARGVSAWKQLVPGDIRSSVEDRIAKQEANKPYEVGLYQTMAAKLMFCQFSDYFKIVQMKVNWPLFVDVFGTESSFTKYGSMAIEARNALKHGRDLSHVDLAAAEAGLSWLEESLSKIRLEEEGEEEPGIVEAI